MGTDSTSRERRGQRLRICLSTLSRVSAGAAAGAEAVADAAATFEVDLRAPRPRVVVDEADLAAHESRLAQLRKKAGKAVWDAWAETDEPVEALSA